jgi:hypothetical protein
MAKHVVARCTHDFFGQLRQVLRGLVYLQHPDERDTQAVIVLEDTDDNSDFIRELVYCSTRARVVAAWAGDDPPLDGDAGCDRAIADGWAEVLCPLLRGMVAGVTPSPTCKRTDAVLACLCPELVSTRVRLRERPAIAVYIGTYTDEHSTIAYYQRAVALLPPRAAVVVFANSPDTMQRCMHSVWIRALRHDTFFATGMSGACMLIGMARCSHFVMGSDAAWCVWAALFAEAWFAPLLPVVVVPNDWRTTPQALARPFWRTEDGCGDLQRSDKSAWQPLVSVCIPVYSMHGRGAKFLEAALHSVTAQTYRNLQVVVCDNSLHDPSLQQVCAKHPEVVYLANARGRGALAPNFNHAVDFAAGLVIKPLLQDDLLCGPDAVGALVRALMREDGEGLACPAWAAGVSLHHDGSGRSLHREHAPRDAPAAEWLRGINTIGAPTAVAWTATAVRFLPSLFNLVDTVCYAHLKAECGPPRIVPSAVCSICLWEGTVTNTQLSAALHAQELMVIATAVPQ